MNPRSRPVVVGTKYGSTVMDAAREGLERLALIEDAHGIQVYETGTPSIEMRLYNIAFQTLPKTGSTRSRIARFVRLALSKRTSWTSDRVDYDLAGHAHAYAASALRTLLEEHDVDPRGLFLHDGTPWRAPSLRAYSSMRDVSAWQPLVHSLLARQPLRVWLSKEGGNRKWPLRFGTDTSTELDKVPTLDGIETMRLYARHGDAAPARRMR